MLALKSNQSCVVHGIVTGSVSSYILVCPGPKQKQKVLDKDERIQVLTLPKANDDGIMGQSNKRSIIEVG
jgi:hypothetical protein